MTLLVGGGSGTVLRWLSMPMRSLLRWLQPGSRAGGLPGAWTLRDGGALAWVSGVAPPTLNGVWTERADPDPDAVAGLLDRVQAAGMPYCLQLRPGASAALAGLAAARAMSLETPIPLMITQDPAAVTRAQRPGWSCAS